MYESPAAYGLPCMWCNVAAYESGGVKPYCLNHEGMTEEQIRDDLRKQSAEIFRA